MLLIKKMRIFASKKFLIIAGMILALFIGIAIGSSFNLSKMGRTGNIAANIVNETALKNENGGDN